MDESKAIGIFKLKVGATLTPFTKYGLDIFIQGAIDAIAKEALILHRNLLQKIDIL